MELKGTSSVVTGGASGLGEATARLLASRGVHVVIADLNEANGAALATEIGGTFVRTDVASEENAIEAVEAATAAAPLWSAVNCAGIGWAERTIGRDGEYASAHSLDSLRKIFEVNVVGTVNISRIAATAMSHNTPDEDGCRGAIVHTASIAAEDGQIGQLAYATSKGGVVGMTLPMARDLEVVGVRVNCILPGLINTPIYGTSERAEEFKSKLAHDVLFPHRLGHPEEYASMCVELLGNSYMNAETIRVDAGIRMQPK